MAKVALITDTHFGVRNDATHFNDYMETFYADVFFPTLEKENINTVFHLGDMFDRRKYINFHTLKRAREFFFDPLRDRGIQMIAHVGNHDVYYKSTNDVNSPILLLREYNNITTHDTATTIDVDGTKIAMLPWVCNGNLKQSLEFIETAPAQILFGHLEIRGFEMHYPGQMCDSGFLADLFKRFALVLSGHFHHRSTQGNITYLGAPYEMTWSDYNDPRGFHLFDTETMELTFVQNPYRMFYKVYYNDETNDVDKLIEQSYDHVAGRYVKIVVQEKNNPYAFERLVDKIERANPIDLAFANDSLDISFEDEEDLDVEDTSAIIASSVEQAISNPVKQQIVKAFLLELYSDAVNSTTV